MSARHVEIMVTVRGRQSFQSRTEILQEMHRRSVADAESFRLELEELRERRSSMVDGDRMSDEQYDRARRVYLDAQDKRTTEQSKKSGKRRPS